MRKLLTFAIAAIVLLAMAETALAAGTPQPGDIGIFFDANGTETGRSGVAAFVPFNLYVCSFDVPSGMEAYEFSVQMPAGSIVSGGRALPPGASDFGQGDDNWIVGTGGNCYGTTGVFSTVVYSGVLYLGAVMPDQQICMGGASPSSFADGRPGYLACNSPGDLRGFGSAYAGCAVINPTTEPPIPVDASSWGSVKVSY